MLVIKTISMIIITVVFFVIAKMIQKKWHSPLLNPAIIAGISIIVILQLFHISYNTYMLGGQWINYLLGCTVVSLAYPLYLHTDKIIKYAPTIFLSVFSAIILNFLLIFSTLKILGYAKEDIATLLPRSVTAAVGLQISKQIGGDDTITILFILATGIIGSILGSYLLEKSKFQSSIAKGMSLGNASHAFGTARALELDNESGAFSSVAMILSAILSSFLLPIFLMFLY